MRLKLNRETVRVLATTDLRKAAGGNPPSVGCVSGETRVFLSGCVCLPQNVAVTGSGCLSAACVSGPCTTLP